MNWKTAAAFALGITGGLVISQSVKRQRLSPEQTLKKVKSSVKQQYNLDGAWIYLQPEEMVFKQLNYEVYRGGLTIELANGIKHYDFIADAHSGTVLDFTPNE